MSNKDIKYLRGFSIIQRIGRVKLTHPENYLGNLEDVWKATPAYSIKEVIPASDTESLLQKQLSAKPTHIYRLCRNGGLPIPTVNSNLAMVEHKGLIKQMGAMNYVLAREVIEEYRVRVD
jgi:DNA processing protein